MMRGLFIILMGVTQLWACLHAGEGAAACSGTVRSGDSVHMQARYRESAAAYKRLTQRQRALGAACQTANTDAQREMLEICKSVKNERARKRDRRTDTETFTCLRS